MKTEHVIASASTLTGWRKSSHSGGGNGECLEVVDGFEAGVPVRDSKVPSGPALVFEPTAWSSFVSAVRTGGLGG